MTDETHQKEKIIMTNEEYIALPLHDSTPLDKPIGYRFRHSVKESLHSVVNQQGMFLEIKNVVLFDGVPSTVEVELKIANISD